MVDASRAAYDHFILINMKWIKVWHIFSFSRHNNLEWPAERKKMHMWSHRRLSLHIQWKNRQYLTRGRSIFFPWIVLFQVLQKIWIWNSLLFGNVDWRVICYGQNITDHHLIAKMHEIPISFSFFFHALNHVWLTRSSLHGYHSHLLAMTSSIKASLGKNENWTFSQTFGLLPSLKIWSTKTRAFNQSSDYFSSTGRAWK